MLVQVGDGLGSVTVEDRTGSLITSRLMCCRSDRPVVLHHDNGAQDE
jgi:hypothetical protein